MNARKTDFRLVLNLVASVCVALSAPAFAQESEEMAKLTKPESSITGGGTYVSGDKRDRARFGQYNGMRDGNGYGNFDFDYTKRDEATGLWTILQGRDLLLDTRELNFSQQLQGDWKVSGEYNSIVRNYPNTINTALQGIGTNNLTVTRTAPGTGNDVDLKTKREGIGFSGEKWLSSQWQFETSFKTENKTGSRIFGRAQPCNATAATTANGYACVAATAVTVPASAATSGATGGAILLLPEPINYTMNNFDAKLNYHDEKMAISAAYYGSWFTNSNGSMNQTFNGLLFNPNGSNLNPALTAAGGNNLAGPFALGGPLSLQPNNQSHQFSLAGNYTFSPTTRSTFKLSATRGTQNQSYSSMGLANGTEPRSSLGAVIDTLVGQVGITSRLTDKMTVLGNLRVENKSDKTPIDVYTTTSGRTNGRSSHSKIAGKMEATYQFPMGYRATGGIDVDMRDFGMLIGTLDTSGQASAIRQKTIEWGYRGEVRKSMSETVNGSIGLGRSQRNGTNWMNATTKMTQGDSTFPGAYNLFPLFFADLTRDKVKGSIDWAAMDNLSLQFFADASREHYLMPSVRGARDGATRQLGVDASLALNSDWNMTGWLTRGDQILDINGAAGAYSEGMRTLSHAMGLGLKGKPAPKWEVGADFRMSYETNRYAQGYTTTTTATPADLPAVAYRQLSLNLSAKYALDKKSDVRLNFIHQRYESNEWYWSNAGVPFFYSDGTTVSQQAGQNVNMMTVNYTYNF